ncbi:MAG: L-lactate permease [Verrucomicrobia bacterium]|nr:L-lactate permease [Verrucomicrobiota bacterium]
MVSNFHGPWLVDIVSSLSSLAGVTLLLKVWRPRQIWRLPGASGQPLRPPGGSGCESAQVWSARNLNRPAPVDGLDPGQESDVTAADEPSDASAGSPLGPAAQPTQAEARGYGKLAAPQRRPTGLRAGEPARLPAATASGPGRASNLEAWLPWLLLSVFVFMWGLPVTKDFLNGISLVKIPVTALDRQVLRMPPVVTTPQPEEAVFKLDWLSATGSGILAAAIVAGLVMRFSIAELGRAYWKTCKEVRLSLLTIAAMLALGYVTRYSGTDATLGLALARTGVWYPCFGTLLGWLGVTITGSDTASNVLFGSLQTVTAHQLHLNPVLMAAANSSGGVMGKMAAAQSIVVATTATDCYGQEGAILRWVFFHSLALATLVGILVSLQAYVAPFTRLVVAP